MSEHFPLRRPPAECPNDGVCSSLIPRLEDCEQANINHAKVVGEIGVSLGSLRDEVHEIKITLRERDKLGSFLQTAFMSILGVLVVQLFASIWWASSLTHKLETSMHKIEDHEARLRAHTLELRQSKP
jgi:hypothetical protein